MSAIACVTGSKYSDEVRRAAVASFIVLGDMQKVAQAVDVPARTLRDWKNSDWWGALAAEVRREKDGELDAAMTGIIHAAAAELRDRIEHGDAVIVDGKVKRKPMSGRDLAIAMAVVHDKRQLLRNQPTAITSESTEDRLARIAEWLQERGSREPVTITQKAVG